MASSPKCISILVIVVALFSTQVLARDSQFFSKVSSRETTETETHVNPTQNDKKQPEQDPLFVPETQNGGYALYGHESGQLPPSTTTTVEPTTYEPYTTVATGYVPRQQTYDAANLPQEGNDNKNYKYHNRNTYESNLPQEGNDPPAGTSFDEETYTTNNNNNQYYNNNNNENNMADTSFVQKTYTTENQYDDKVYNNERQGMSDTRFLENGKYHYDLNSEINQNGQMKQGMSDTRFLENGKYFHDLNNENNNYNYNPNQYQQHQNTYSNNGGSHYANNNYEYNNNNMREIQNADVDNFNDDQQFEP